MKRSGLKRPTVEQVRAWNDKPRKPIARGTAPLKRATKAIAKVGPKAKREKAALDAFREQVKNNARGLCQAPWYQVVDGRIITVAHSHTGHPHGGGHSHHVWPEDHDYGIHDPVRGLYLCSASHRWAHDNPDDAKIVGLLRPEEET